MTIRRDDILRDPNLVNEFVRTQEHLLPERQDIQLALRLDETVGPAMFRPDPKVPGGYIANSLTLRAVRRDIFVLGTLEEIAEEIPCGRCSRPLDRQFWKLCPYCGSELLSL